MPEPKLLPEEMLKAIRERAERATPGPWIVAKRCGPSQTDDTGLREVIPTGREFVAVRKDRIWQGREKMEVREYRTIFAANRKFAAHARTDIPALLAHIEALAKDKADLEIVLATTLADLRELRRAVSPRTDGVTEPSDFYIKVVHKMRDKEARIHAVDAD